MSMDILTAILLKCGVCHGDDLPLVLVKGTGRGKDSRWEMYVCLSCFKSWKCSFKAMPIGMDEADVESVVV